MSLLQIEKEAKTCWRRGEDAEMEMVIFLEREGGPSLSLDYRAIPPSAVVGTRREAALRGETYAWASDLRSFDKLREVGDLSYLGFTLYLSVL